MSRITHVSFFAHQQVDLDEEKQQIERLKLATDPERTGSRSAEAIERDVETLEQERQELEQLTGIYMVRVSDI